MKPVEFDCYSLMNTLLIKASLHKLDITNNENSFANYTIKELKTMEKTGAISAAVKNYFLKHINPKARGFANRWLEYYRVTDRIYQANKALSGSTDVQKLEHACKVISEQGFAVAFNASHSVSFENEEAEKMQESGCFIVTEAVIGKSSNGMYEGVFPCFYQVQSMRKLSTIIDACQMSGFGIMLDRNPYKIKQLAPLDLAPYRLMQG